MKILPLVQSWKSPLSSAFESKTLHGKTVRKWVEDSLSSLDLATPRYFEIDPQSTSPRTYFETLEQFSEGFDTVFLVSADSPFLNAEATRSMLDLHTRYRADYTFADGYPTGMTGELVHPRIWPTLKQWAEKEKSPVSRETLFQVLSTDINQFDVETEISPVDLRTARLHLTADSQRNFMYLERVAPWVDLPVKELLERMRDRIGLRRTLPAFAYVQIVDAVIQVPNHTPVQKIFPQITQLKNSMARERWNSILDKLLALSGDIAVMPSFWCEPSLHPQIVDLLCDAAAKPGIRIALETSGLDWKRSELERLQNRIGNSIDWIVELDSNQKESYQSIRGDGFEIAQKTTLDLIELFPGRVYPQSVRTLANEEEMESFFRFWKEKAGNVIIQKPNDFGGRFPKLKVADLSPWKRHPCWHSQRDLSIFLDGSVVICRDDFNKSLPLGNIDVDPIQKIWENGQTVYEAHALGEYPEVCRLCDEYYTYFF